MEREEQDLEQAEGCALCGASVGSSPDRSYAFGLGNRLCMECATRRGGRYDAERDVWQTPPDLAGLADEAYGASPHEMRRGRRRG